MSCIATIANTKSIFEQVFMPLRQRVAAVYQIFDSLLTTQNVVRIAQIGSIKSVRALVKTETGLIREKDVAVQPQMVAYILEPWGNIIMKAAKCLGKYFTDFALTDTKRAFTIIMSPDPVTYEDMFYMTLDTRYDPPKTVGGKTPAVYDIKNDAWAEYYPLNQFQLSFPGGSRDVKQDHTQSLERFLETAFREASEETGIEIDKLAYIDNPELFPINPETVGIAIDASDALFEKLSLAAGIRKPKYLRRSDLPVGKIVGNVVTLGGIKKICSFKNGYIVDAEGKQIEVLAEQYAAGWMPISAIMRQARLNNHKTECRTSILPGAPLCRLRKFIVDILVKINTNSCRVEYNSDDIGKMIVMARAAALSLQ